MYEFAAIRPRSPPRARRARRRGRRLCDLEPLLPRCQVDLDETYRWGLAELDRIEAQQRQVAEQIVPVPRFDEAVEALDADRTGDPRHRRAQAWMQEQSDEVSALNGVHFDIPEPIRASSA